MCTGRAMFLTPCWPISVKPIGNFSPTCSRTEALTQISPGAASVWSRAAMLTPSPKMSPSSWMTSPRLMPMRKRMRSVSGRLALRSSIPCRITTAQRTASTTEANSIRMPSPVVSKMRPRCWLISGSMSSRRSLLRTAKVPSSSAPISREYPATSAQRIAASRLSTRSSATAAFPLRRQARYPQRFGHRRGDFGRRVVHRAEFGDAEARLQRQYSSGRRLRLVDMPELRKRRSQYHVGIAEARIALDRLAGRIRRILVAALAETCDGDAEPRPESEGIEGAETQRLFAPFDCTLCLARPSANDAAHAVGQCRRRAHGDRRLERFACGGTVVLDHANVEAPECQRHGVVATMHDGSMGMADGSLTVFFASACPHKQDLMAPRGIAVRERVVGLQGQRALQERQRLRRTIRHRGIDKRSRPKHQVVGIQTIRPLASDTLDLGLAQARLDRADHARRDLVLQCKNVVDRAVVAFGPDVPAALGLDQLAGDAHPARRAAHAAFEHVAHTKLTADPSDVGGFPLVGKARIARDDEQPFDARQSGDDVLDHAVDKIILLGITAHIGERQYSDRRPVGQRQWCCCRLIRGICTRFAALFDAVDAYRPCNVLDAVLAHIGKPDRELLADLLAHRGADADLAGLGERLESCGDIDAVAKHVAF